MNNVVVTAPGASTTNLGVSGGTPVLNNVLTDDDGGTKVIFQPSTDMALNETTPLADKGLHITGVDQSLPA